MAEASAAYSHRGTLAVQRMVEHAPSTGGLALWVRHQDVPGPADGGQANHRSPAWTDGHTVFYTPDFAKLSLPRQTACVAHEVLHIALRHGPRYLALKARLGQADLQLFNVCADAIVNTALSHLAWLQLPAEAVRLETLLANALGQQQQTESALLAWDVERLYLAVDERWTETPARARLAAAKQGGDQGQTQRGEQGQGQGKGSAPNGQGPTQAGATSTPKPGQGEAQPSAQGGGRNGDPEGGPHDGPRAARTRAMARPEAADLQPAGGASQRPEDEAEAALGWRERLLRAHAGDGEQSMLRALLADLPRLRTPWEQALRSQLAHGLVQKPALSWSRPARSWLANQGRTVGGQRLPWEPGICATRPAPRLVVVDVSGSIDAPLLARFAAEIESISRRLEAALVLVLGDLRVRQVRVFEPGRGSLQGITCQGGGGTDFTPLLEEAQAHRPDITVVLTDLDGPARFKPRCPVVWAVPEAHQHAVPPFGRLLVLH